MIVYSVESGGEELGMIQWKLERQFNFMLQLLPLQGLRRSLDLVACTEERYLLAASPLFCGAAGFRQKVWCPSGCPWLVRQLAAINRNATGLGWGCQVCCCSVRQLCKEKGGKTDEFSPMLSFGNSPSVNDMS